MTIDNGNGGKPLMPGGRFATLLPLVLALSFLPPFTSQIFPAGDGTLTQGDPEHGRRLFTGEVRFVEGGAACIGCHSAAGIPGGGGAVGPDLTKTFSDYGAEGLDAALADLSFPTMKPLYAGRPLKPEERAHLAAFLRTAGSAAPEDRWKTPSVAAAAGGFAAVLALLAYAPAVRAGYDIDESSQQSISAPEMNTYTLGLSGPNFCSIEKVAAPNVFAAIDMAGKTCKDCIIQNLTGEYVYGEAPWEAEPRSDVFCKEESK